MKNRFILTAAAAVLLAACDNKAGTASQPAPGAAQAEAPAGYAKKATYFRLPGIAGGEVDLASYSGKPVLVVFFTETCPYCRKAAPFIQQAAAAYGPKGLATVGICVQDSEQAAKNFAGDFGLTFPVAYKGKDVSRNYRTQGVPYIYLLTREHEIFDVWEGYDEQYDATIKQGIESVLAKK